MAAIPEIERISRLLEQATIKLGADLGADILGGEPVQVGEVNNGADLVYGMFGYQRRAVGVPGRLLTDQQTRQPVLAVREGDRVTPLPYAEDVASHPLRESLIVSLRSFIPGG